MGAPVQVHILPHTFNQTFSLTVSIPFTSSCPAPRLYSAAQVNCPQFLLSGLSLRLSFRVSTLSMLQLCFFPVCQNNELVELVHNPLYKVNMSAMYLPGIQNTPVNVLARHFFQMGSWTLDLQTACFKLGDFKKWTSSLPP